MTASDEKAIRETCELAGQPARASEFIQRGMTPQAVTAALAGRAQPWGDVFKSLGIEFRERAAAGVQSWKDVFRELGVGTKSNENRG